MLRRGRIKRRFALTAILLATAVAIPAAQASSPGKVNSICRMNYSAALAWSSRAPEIQSDEDMAAWETGVATYFGGTARDLRAVGARTLGTHLSWVAAGHRAA